MQVKFKVNLGINDAQRLAIAPATEGQIADVSDAAGAVVVKRGWAESIDSPAEETSKFTAKKTKANANAD